jgi:hypothetical protein
MLLVCSFFFFFHIKLEDFVLLQSYYLSKPYSMFCIIYSFFIFCWMSFEFGVNYYLVPGVSMTL